MSTGQPLASTWEDGVSQEHNKKVNRDNACREDSESGDFANAAKHGLGIALATGEHSGYR